MAADIPTLVTLEEAQRIVREHVRALPVATVPLADALACTLAEDVRCDTDVPPFDRAMMDGYAVRAADVVGAPVTLKLAGQVAAGSSAEVTLAPGTAVQINTGAPIPAGADAVIKVEDTESSADGGQVSFRSAAKPRQHVCDRGTYVRAGDVVLTAGVRIGPAEIATAATAGAARLSVRRPPRAAVLVTGDELVEAGESLASGRIRDSNGPMLRALLVADGIEPVDLGRVGDDRARLAESVRAGLACDVLCVTGGISMGAFDFVPEVLTECGATMHFRKMATKPGHPTLFATTPAGSAVFALPGNPVSAYVGYWMVVRPGLAWMCGRDGQPVARRAVLCGQSPATRARRSFWPAKLDIDEQARLCATPLTWYGSGDPFGLRGAHGLIVRPPNAPAASDGDAVEVIVTSWPEAG